MKRFKKLIMFQTKKFIGITENKVLIKSIRLCI